jgi:hypothetical protein
MAIRKFIRFFSIGIMLLSVCTTAQAQLIVVPNNNANALTGALLAGSGIPFSNATYTGAVGSAGTFTGGTTPGIGLGINSGILLSSGLVSDAPGPNINDATTTGFGTAGDAQLTAQSGFPTGDAAILQFDFTANAGDDLLFRYVFASEEYNEYVNTQYNDPFAFYLDGVNIALAPSAPPVPVTINNVNGNTTPALYNNNDPSDTATPFNIEYDGFTDVFTASALNLTAGQHTIRLAIADAGDTSLDSTVFLEGEFQLVQNDPPVADLNGPYFADDTTPILTLDASGSTDDGQLVPLTYSWDTDDDGFFDDFFTRNSPFLNIPLPYTFFGGVGVYNVGVQVFDGQFLDSATSTVTIVPEPMSLLLLVGGWPCIVWLSARRRRS